MNVLQNDYILRTLDLPTIEWKQYFRGSELESDRLWNIKVEDVPTRNDYEEQPVEKKNIYQIIKRKRQEHEKNTNILIGVPANTAKQFGEKKGKQIDPKKSMVIYYPYYTAVKSGILDINRDRIVIEGTNGDINHMVMKNEIEVTMIFEEDNLKIVGDDHFFSQEEVLTLIDHSREIKKMSMQDLQQNKNLQLYFSFVHVTNEFLKPEGELQLVYYRFYIF